MRCMYAGECMWIRSSVTQTHMHCTACGPRAEGSDELKTCDEMMVQVDSVQQQIRAAPVNADLRFDRKHKLECMSYMFIVCPLHANYMAIGSTMLLLLLLPLLLLLLPLLTHSLCQNYLCYFMPEAYHGGGDNSK